MLYLLKIPRRYWPVGRIITGAILVILGLAVVGKICWLVGAVWIVWGVTASLGQRRRAAQDREDDAIVDDAADRYVRR
jgi:hypothetical protein